MIPIIDLHADTYCKKIFQYLFKGAIEGYFDNIPLTITDAALKKGGIKVQVQSLFLDDGFLINPLQTALKVTKLMKDDIKANPDLFQVRTSSDITSNLDNDRTGIMISIEGLELLNQDLDMLYIFEELGVRMVGLTWNRITPFLSPWMENYGMFKKGKPLVKILNELNLIADFSHSSTQSFFEMCEILTTPIIASHSNCLALNPFPRNLSDDQIKLIDERKGLIGINFVPDFLQDRTQYSDFELLYNQIDYIASKFSVDIIGFGSDFDGFDDYLPSIPGPEFFPIFVEYLRTRDVSAEDIEKICYKNFLRVFDSK